MDRQTLFHEGMNGYASFRIPSLIALPGGRVVAFCEGRRNSVKDYGAIHIVARVSVDGGAHFGPLRVILSQGEDTVGNPCPVYDRGSGRLHLLYNANLGAGGEQLILQGKAPRTVHHAYSDDLGESWSSPRDITSQVKRADWTWYACGPCHGVQVKSGRLLIPCNHAVLKGDQSSGPYISHAVYSDDGGQSWRAGQDVAEYTNECSLGQLPDGRIYMNMRSYHGKGCRAVALSCDNGASWQDFRLDDQLVDPVCQGSVLTLDAFGESGRPVMFFSNPANPDRRLSLRLRCSRDGGRSWSQGALLHEGHSAYSDLALLPDGQIGCLYEAGQEHAYEGIHWARLKEEDLM